MSMKTADVKMLYAMLRVRMPELPAHSKDFRGFNTDQLNIACHHLKINGFIFYCEVTADGVDWHAGRLAWRSDFVEGGTRVNMSRYKKHLMFIKNIKNFVQAMAVRWL